MDTGPQFNLFLNLLFLVFLTMTNAFFACTEIAMVSINKNKINLENECRVVRHLSSDFFTWK